MEWQCIKMRLEKIIYLLKHKGANKNVGVQITLLDNKWIVIIMYAIVPWQLNILVVTNL